MTRRARYLVLLSWFVSAWNISFAQDSMEARRQRIHAMSSLEKEQLRAKRSRFHALTPRERQRLRQLHEEVANQPKLKQTMQAYFDWLKSLPASQVAELKSLPTSQRMKRIKELRREEHQRYAHHMGSGHLSQQDGQVLVEWAMEFFVLHKDEILANSPAPMRARYQRAKTPRQQALVLLHAVARFDGSPAPNAEKIGQLLDRLSPGARQQLESLDKGSEKKELLVGWLRAAFAARFGVDHMLPPVSRVQLDEFYREHLTAEQKERLHRLAPLEFQRELERLFHDTSRAQRPQRDSRPRRRSPPHRRRSDAQPQK